MAESLLICMQRYLNDPKEFEARLQGKAVLLYDPPAQNEEEEDDDDDFRFRTVSGYSPAPISVGEPAVAWLTKNAANAFQRRITLGRTTNNDVVIESASVSRFHAWFQQEGELWTVADADSKNGTTLDGRPLTPKKAEKLSNGSRVKVGQIELVFHVASGFLQVLKRR